VLSAIVGIQSAQPSFDQCEFLVSSILCFILVIDKNLLEEREWLLSFLQDLYRFFSVCTLRH
jgi:hypothetical protein